jgi:hypothetical protein
MPSNEIPINSLGPPVPPTPVRRVSLSLAMTLAGVAGAWLASLCLYVYDLNQHPEALGDGQYAFGFIQSIPLGWVVGVLVTSLAQAACRFHPPRTLAMTTLGFVALTPIVTLPLLPLVAHSLGVVIHLFGGGS